MLSIAIFTTISVRIYPYNFSTFSTFELFSPKIDVEISTGHFRARETSQMTSSKIRSFQNQSPSVILRVDCVKVTV